VQILTSWLDQSPPAPPWNRDSGDVARDGILPHALLPARKYREAYRAVLHSRAGVSSGGRAGLCWVPANGWCRRPHRVPVDVPDIWPDRRSRRHCDSLVATRPSSPPRFLPAKSYWLATFPSPLPARPQRRRRPHPLRRPNPRLPHLSVDGTRSQARLYRLAHVATHTDVLRCSGRGHRRASLRHADNPLSPPGSDECAALAPCGADLDLRSHRDPAHNPAQRPLQ